VNFTGDPAAAEVLVHRLRRKIEAPAGAEPVIETVRGQGYVIRERR
jgi:DNA-binding response OmpR family regulator